ncbi:hypothetical protein BHE97_03465 [Aeromicrobium sp. PE09-221]|uniref:ABC transporter substrate-binding protein n=1 Tax=Aeromicrobium sp. PE09-221 TaxID=1898043 RepID=UPI000B3E7078|nr:ABC transporter substrate-binding protein [Aeromicrobium sp. PE09-221]OUZ11946.1 hypothetical protein BHE97_03465 [Aeromicrobium sp. PE09-221]
MSLTTSLWRRGATAAASVTLLAGLAACGGSGDDSASGTDQVGLQLNWITNATWAGSYLADENGYYEEAGLDVDILTGGPNVDFMAALSSGQALAAFAGLTEPATLNQDNGDYVVVGTMYQKSPLSFISRAEDDITEPADLEGKRVGISATSQSVWEQFSSTAGIDTSTVEVVPITTGPEAIAADDVDAYLGFITEGPALLEAQGMEANAFLLQDFGYGYYVDVYTVRREDLEDEQKRDQIKRLLKADLQGQLDMINDPEAAAELTVERYGQELGLDYETELATAKAAAELFYSPTTEERGIGYMAGDELTLSMETLNSILGTDLPLDGEGYVDMSLLDEIYEEDPDFGQLPPMDSLG